MMMWLAEEKAWGEQHNEEPPQAEEGEGEGDDEAQVIEDPPAPELGEDPPLVDLDVSSDIEDKQLPPSLDQYQIKDRVTCE